MADKTKHDEPEAEPSEIPAGLVIAADIEVALRGISFPADARSVMERARQNGVDELILDRLSELPERRYTSLGDTLRQLDMLS